MPGGGRESRSRAGCRPPSPHRRMYARLGRNTCGSAPGLGPDPHDHPPDDLTPPLPRAVLLNQNLNREFVDRSMIRGRRVLLYSLEEGRHGLGAVVGMWWPSSFSLLSFLSLGVGTLDVQHWGGSVEGVPMRIRILRLRGVDLVVRWNLVQPGERNAAREPRKQSAPPRKGVVWGGVGPEGPPTISLVSAGSDYLGIEALMVATASSPSSSSQVTCSFRNQVSWRLAYWRCRVLMRSRASSSSKAPSRISKASR